MCRPRALQPISLENFCRWRAFFQKQFVRSVCSACSSGCANSVQRAALRLRTMVHALATPMRPVTGQNDCFCKRSCSELHRCNSAGEKIGQKFQRALGGPEKFFDVGANSWPVQRILVGPGVGTARHPAMLQVRYVRTCSCQLPTA